MNKPITMLFPTRCDWFCSLVFTYPARRSFLLSYSRETLRESSKMFVERTLHFARIQFGFRPNSCALGTAGLVMTIGHIQMQ